MQGVCFSKGIIAFWCIWHTQNLPKQHQVMMMGLGVFAICQLSKKSVRCVWVYIQFVRGFKGFYDLPICLGTHAVYQWILLDGKCKSLGVHAICENINSWRLFVFGHTHSL